MNVQELRINHTAGIPLIGPSSYTIHNGMLQEISQQYTYIYLQHRSVDTNVKL